jgi:hypothetical protein
MPVEHGGWGLLIEPLLAGVVLAPSSSAPGLVVAAAGAFLLRHPLKLLLADRRRGARYPRTAAAERVAAAYAGIAALGALAALATAPGQTWLPLLAAAPLGAFQLVYDARHQGRRLAPELMGAVALGSTACALTLADGWAAAAALSLWALMAMRAVSSVTYVRARLRRQRGQEGGTGVAIGVQAAALVAAAALAGLGIAPRLAVLAFAVLLGRAAQGLSPHARPASTRAVGFSELAYGALTTALIAAGYLWRA